MQRRDLGLLLTGAAVAAAIFGLYQWRASSAAPDAAAASAPSAMQATPGTGSQAAAPAVNGATAQGGTPGVPSVADSTARLAARLQKSGGSAADWQLLGKSYDFLGMKPEADAAWARGGGRPAGTAPASLANAAAAMPGAAASAARTGANTASAATGPRLAGTIDIAPRLRASVPANAVLFVFAKSAVLAGPPLAAAKLAAKDWPVSFTLDDASAMMPGTSLASAEKLVVEARISASGNPLAQPGDLAGSVANIDPRKAGPLRIVIDHEVQKAR